MPYLMSAIATHILDAPHILASVNDTRVEIE